MENLTLPELLGDTHVDEKTRERFSKDASSYRITPQIVIEPKNEADVIKTIEFARNAGLALTARSGGSGLSGAAIGPGIVLNFKKYMNRVLNVGEETVVQPGTVLDAFLKQMHDEYLMLPSVPSSSALCALGGNIGARSTGPRTARYGTIDTFVTSLRFVTARGEIIDTRETLPEYLEQGLRKIKQEYQNDQPSQAIINARPYIAGGYNIKALGKYENPAEMATHLMVSSVGTLGIVTEIRLKLLEHTPSLGTFVAHFRSIEEFAEAATRLKMLSPAALEFSDASCSKHVSGKILNYSDPSIVGTLIVEFDDSLQQADAGRSILEDYKLSQLWEIPSGSDDEAALWQDRRQILPSIWKYARQRGWGLPSIIDDIAIHLKDFSAVHRSIQELMKYLDLEISFFGHLGFGSIHARPYFNTTGQELIDQIMIVSSEAFNILRKYNGTLVGEHNAGRSRSVYLEPELGPAFTYMKKIKDLFDPDDILNPKTVFDTDPIFEHMDFSFQ
ncbi:FAD-binding oxidoreductase [candidate division KSB1 bacterium]|nr:FAD-binding oxidoreductase [candidate division KSB1 bacterium]